MREALARFAAGAPVPVFPLTGTNFVGTLELLEHDPRVRLVTSPRSANILLLVGGLAPGLLRAGCRVHDQMSHPRMTLWWPQGAETRRLRGLFPDLEILDPSSDLVERLVRIHGSLLSRRRGTEAAILPDEEPAPWRGVGPYGQGGKGMTGGVPYGRPMAERAADRDGLELDQLLTRVGPFFRVFPPGLTLDVHLQGDLVQKIVVVRGPLRGEAHSGSVAVAGGDPPEIRSVELARARHHLLWLAQLLDLMGLHALSDRSRRLSWDIEPAALSSVRRLQRMLERPGGLGWSTAGVAPLPAGSVEEMGGPVARASGVVRDARLDDPTYERLGFQPVTHLDGDVRARWRQRLAEVEQALELAGRAGSTRTKRGRFVEGPRGPVKDHGSPGEVPFLEDLPGLLAGMEWGDAVTAVVSLDLGWCSS